MNCPLSVEGIGKYSELACVSHIEIIVGERTMANATRENAT